MSVCAPAFFARVCLRSFRGALVFLCAYVFCVLACFSEFLKMRMRVCVCVFACVCACLCVSDIE